MLALNLHKKSFIIVILALITIIKGTIFEENHRTFMELFEWAQNNGLEYGKKINFENVPQKYPSANDLIKEGEIILKFPEETLLSINSALKTLPKKLKKAWTKFQENSNETASDIDKQISFLCFLQQNVYIKKKGKFYEYFRNYLENKNENMETYPTFYTDEEKEMINFSYLTEINNKIKEIYTNECKKFSIEYNLKCDQELYLMYRADHNSLRKNNKNAFYVPLINKFKTHPFNYNAIEEFDYEKNAFIIKAQKGIKPNEEIVIKSIYKSNTDNLLYNGFIFKDLKDNVSIRLSFMNEDLAKNLNYTEENETIKVDLNDDSYMKTFMDHYLNLTAVKYGKEDYFEAYRILYHNIKGFMDEDTELDMEGFNKKVLVKANKINIKYILEEEKKLVDRRMKEVKEKLYEAKKAKEALGLEAIIEIENKEVKYDGFENKDNTKDDDSTNNESEENGESEDKEENENKDEKDKAKDDL